METPNTPAGQMTDRIMLAIREHVKDGEYNAAWSKVLELLNGVPVIPKRALEAHERTAAGKVTCPRLVYTGGSLKACGLPWPCAKHPEGGRL